MKSNFLVIPLFCVFVSLSATAQFIEQTIQPTPFANVSHCAAAWGDYNNDNRLDVLITGNVSSVIYTNNTFFGLAFFVPLLSATELPPLYYSTVEWGDYDNDGDLDFVLTGTLSLAENGVSANKQISRIYRNDGGSPCVFKDIGADLIGICRGDAAWGDYDNDRDLDLIIAGDTTGTGAKGITKIYKNQGGGDSFIEETGIVLPGVAAGSSVGWADYDKDGDLDFILTGKTEGAIPRITKIYRNNYPQISFTEQPFSFLGSQAGSSAWGDYDKDGDEDLIVAGLGTVKLYRNNYPANSFTDIVITPEPLIQVTQASVKWGDYDNDGDLDILLSGSVGFSDTYTKIYKNGGGNVFIEQTINPAPLVGISVGSATWADYDNDKDLDILVTGFTQEHRAATKLYRNTTAINNTNPIKPTELVADVNGNRITINWNAGSDNETPVAGLTYNIVVSKEYEGFELMSPMSNIETGFRRIVSSGNTRHRRSWTVKGLSGGMTGQVYYCGVQTIDNSFAGSKFEIQKFWVPGFIQNNGVLLGIALVIVISVIYAIIKMKRRKRNM
jgi:FG-GAP-like repeat